MNYLAHAFLSFNNPEILAGNMISDFVKGKKKFDYPVDIQQGIHLHRLIDTFTDEHPAVKKAKEVFRPHYRLYAAAFVDVVFDHYLAIDNQHFTDKSLRLFAETTYEHLHSYSSFFPERFAGMFPYMWKQNWLYHYSSKWGIENSLKGVVRRAAYLEESDTAYRLFNEKYRYLQDCYLEFFPSLYQMSRNWFTEYENRTQGSV